MAPTGYPETNQWLLAEDEALKNLLTGLVVPGDKPGRKVPVYFRFPESERQIVYPFITIDLIGIEPAYDLWTSDWWMAEDEMIFEDPVTGEEVLPRGLYEPSVSRSVFTAGGTLDPNKPLRRRNYLWYRLFYQITTWSKTFAHDRVLTAQMLRYVFRPRPMWLHVPADDTWRRMEVLGWQPTDLPTQEGNIKRIFRKAITLSMQTEITQDELEFIEQGEAVRRIAMRGFYQQFPDEVWTEDESHIEPGDAGWEILHDEDAP